MNHVGVEHLRKVRGEEEDFFESHRYDLTMDDLEKLLEGRKQRDRNADNAILSILA